MTTTTREQDLVIEELGATYGRVNVQVTTVAIVSLPPKSGQGGTSGQILVDEDGNETPVPRDKRFGEPVDWSS